MAEHSVTWTEAPTATPEEKPRKKRRKVHHLFNPEADEFAKANGVQVRAFCGVWVGFDRRTGPVPLGGLDPDDCARCVAVFHRMVRDTSR